MSPQKDAAKFGLFCGVFSTSYKAVLCLLRRLGCHNDSINAPIAGFISAFSLVVDVKPRKQLMMILIMSRAFDSVVNLGEDRGVLPQSRYKYIIIWVVASTFLQSAMGYQQDILNKGLFKFYKKWSFLTVQDQ